MKEFKISMELKRPELTSSTRQFSIRGSNVRDSLDLDGSKENNETKERPITRRNLNSSSESLDDNSSSKDEDTPNAIYDDNLDEEFFQQELGKIDQK